MINLNWEFILTTLAATFLALIVYQAVTYQKVDLATGNVSTKVGIPGTGGSESDEEDGS